MLLDATCKAQSSTVEPKEKLQFNQATGFEKGCCKLQLMTSQSHALASVTTCVTRAMKWNHSSSDQPLPKAGVVSLFWDFIGPRLF